MVEIKLTRNTDGGLQYLRNLCKYALKKEAIVLDGIGVNPYDSDDAFMQMTAVKRYFRKTSGNPLIHIVVSYDESVTDPFRAMDLSKEIASFYGSRFQLLWFLHRKKREHSTFHVHLVINSVGYIDGRMFHSGRIEMNEFSLFVREVTGQRTFFSFVNMNQSVTEGPFLTQS